ncbi:hypothetical protein [Aliidiomarina maris]|uniref:Uncharacterized protein n=1 Tax=Aliidiomarina maris TaxID=531312 RepID=A0A327WWT6_9GAMM|nr:hypothetical protein [Aliidiomarina maris]RAJ93955.1 hypothetical protein B0I24_11558 [Aliidiomarina maris]RUO27540.1 hypothetical protein CWE07_02610 [Aliidiomarina maris]
MESKYVNYFDEIKHKSEREQLHILSEARYEAFVIQRLGVKAAVYLTLLVASLAAFMFVVQAYLSPSFMFFGFVQALVIVDSLAAYKYLSGKLLYKGLKRVLAEGNANN